MLTLKTRDKLVVISVHGGPKEVKDEQCKGGAAAEVGDRTLINTLQPISTSRSADNILCDVPVCLLE